MLLHEFLQEPPDMKKIQKYINRETGKPHFPELYKKLKNNRYGKLR